MSQRTTLLALSLFAALLACGKIESIPVSSLTDPPRIIFFNGNDANNLVRLWGTAYDPNGVSRVEVSFDGGATYFSTLATPAGGGTWYLDVKAADLPGSYTLVSRATNAGDKVEVPGPGTAGTKVVSIDPAVLSAQVSASYSGTAAIYLSGGSGGAYLGSSSAPLLLANVSPMVLVGKGSGSGGTLLQVPASAARLFSVGASLALRGIHARGGRVGVEVALAPGAALAVELASCYLGSQTRWGVKAEGRAAHASSLAVSLTGCTIDALAGITGSGGVNLKNASVAVDSCVFQNARVTTEGDESAALFIANPTGAAAYVDSCLFTGNAFPLKSSNGSPVISSCQFKPGAFSQANGILLRGSGTPSLRRNLIDGNGGFGVKVKDDGAPVFYKNRISGNGQGGVVVDGNGANPNLGDINVPSSTGHNDIFGNLIGSNGDAIPESQGVGVYVTSATPFSAAPVKAQNNYWGPGVTTQGQVNGLTVDGNDYGLGRAVVVTTFFQATPQSGL